MEINRNQYFLLGLLLLFLGFEFRMVESATLSPQATRYLAEYADHPVIAASDAVEAIVGSEPNLPPKTIRPPDWLGWCLMSMGSVLILHSLAMPKPA